MTDLIQRVEESIHRRSLLEDGDRVMAAVSGGVDSMVLLHALRTLSHRHRWKLSVAHFNHQLRGRAADADERLVRRTAAAMKLPVIAGRADVKAFARQSKLSMEMAARKLRHEFFARAARDRKIKTIALAHHADDQVELFFIRLLRGAGPEGLAGMKWRSPSAVDRTISLVRPLLDFPKTDLSAFARARAIRHRDDATNTSTDFLRNRVRHELLPLLAGKYQPATSRVVLRLIEILGAESEFLADFCRGQDDESRIGSKLPGGHFEQWPIAVQRRLLHARLSRAGVIPDFELVEALRESPNHPVSIASNLSVVRNESGKIQLQARAEAEFGGDQLAVDLDAAEKALFGGAELRWKLFKASKGSKSRIVNGKQPIRQECFDADSVGSRIVLRHWQPGDRVRLIGMTSARKLQDTFTDAKVPRAERHRRIVAATAAGEIFWVEGLRMTERFKLTARTKRRLLWAWRRNS